MVKANIIACKRSGIIRNIQSLGRRKERRGKEAEHRGEGGDVERRIRRQKRKRIDWKREVVGEARGMEKKKEMKVKGNVRKGKPMYRGGRVEGRNQN